MRRSSTSWCFMCNVVGRSRSAHTTFPFPDHSHAIKHQIDVVLVVIIWRGMHSPFHNPIDWLMLTPLHELLRCCVVGALPVAPPRSHPPGATGTAGPSARSRLSSLIPYSTPRNFPVVRCGGRRALARASSETRLRPTAGFITVCSTLTIPFFCYTFPVR